MVRKQAFLLPLLLLLLSILIGACNSGAGEHSVPSPSRAELSPANSPASNNGVTTISFACSDSQRSQYESLAEGFQEVNPSIRIQLLSFDDAAGIQRQGNIGMSSGNPYENLASTADSFVSIFSRRPDRWPYLLNLEPFIEDPSFPTDDFYPGTLDHFRWQGGIYGLPAELTPFLIFYDQQAFDEAGLSYPQAGWTWDDFLETAVQLTQWQEGQVSRYGFVDPWYRYTVPVMAEHFGVSLWDDRFEPPRPLFDSVEVIDVLRRYRDLVFHYGVMPVPEVGWNATAYDLIQTGRAAMWTDLATFRESQASRTNLGLAPYPEGVHAANPRTVYGFFVSTGTSQPEAAWRWINYLSANYRPAGYVSGVLPGRRSVGEQLPWWTQLDSETKTVFEYVLAHPPAAAAWPDHYVGRAMRDVFEDGMSVEDALAAAQAQALDWQAQAGMITPEAPHVEIAPQLSPQEGQTVITFAPASSRDLALYRRLAIAFQANYPNVWIEMISPALYTAEVTYPDCFAAPASLLRYASEVRRDILTLDPFIAGDRDLDLEDYYPQLLDPLRRDGELWGLPYETDALMVFVSLSLFTEAGLSIPDPGWSMDEFLTMAGRLSAEDTYGFTTKEGVYGDLLFALERLGAHLVDDSHDPSLPTFDDPTVASALEQYAGLARMRALTPATPSTQSGWPDAVTMGMQPAGVRAGKVAMWVDSIKNQAVAPSLPFEVAMAPLPAGAEQTTQFDVVAYYISAHSSAPQVCWQWITYLSAQPQVVTALPASRNVAASPEWQAQVGEAALPAYRATLEYGDTPIFRLRWEIPWLAYTYPWLDDAFQAVVAGQDAQAALATVQTRVEQLIACAEESGGFADRKQLRACALEVDPEYPAVP